MGVLELVGKEEGMTNNIDWQYQNSEILRPFIEWKNGGRSQKWDFMERLPTISRLLIWAHARIGFFFPIRMWQNLFQDVYTNEYDKTGTMEIIVPNMALGVT